MSSFPELIDSHAHIYLPDFDEDRGAMVQRAVAAGVKKIFLPNIDAASIEPLLTMVEAYPDLCAAMIGLHPCSVKENMTEEFERVKKWVENFPFVAIGEIGTDLYWDMTFREEQIRCFLQQIELAKTHRLPIVIHSRETLDLNIDLVGKMADPDLSGVFHCFTGTLEQAQRIIELGFYMGIGGVVTFRNSGLDAVVAQLPLESLVLETDAPYLSPHPHRGKRNEPAYLSIVAQKIAEVQGRTYDEVCRITSDNARSLFSNQAIN